MSDLIVRLADEKDVERIAEMEQVCFPEEPWSLAAVWEDVMQNQRSFYLVGEIEGRIIGYAGVWKILEEGHITNVAVDPEYRRRHIGETLMKVLIRETEKLGVEKWTLEVRRSNSGAISMYENLGFKVEGIRPEYYENNGEDALIMWR